MMNFHVFLPNLDKNPLFLHLPIVSCMIVTILFIGGLLRLIIQNRQKVMEGNSKLKCRICKTYFFRL